MFCSLSLLESSVFTEKVRARAVPFVCPHTFIFALYTSRVSLCATGRHRGVRDAVATLQSVALRECVPPRMQISGRGETD